jgi:hypothetical protein
MSPLLAALDDEVTQNEPLFKRIQVVYDVTRPASTASNGGCPRSTTALRTTGRQARQDARPNWRR